jgi:hypothetical protein
MINRKGSDKRDKGQQVKLTAKYILHYRGVDFSLFGCMGAKNGICFTSFSAPDCMKYIFSSLQVTARLGFELPRARRKRRFFLFCSALLAHLT